MPELPEVETTLRGLAPYLKGHCIAKVLVRNPALRWPVDPALERILPGLVIESLDRRAKYLLLDCGRGTLILHLGMSGSLRFLAQPEPPGPWDHFELQLEDDGALRLTDPRRFGAVLWTTSDPRAHPLLAHLGPEPLSAAFDATALHRATRGRSAAIKQVIMDAHVVVGVGNIYASEALFAARIDPRTPARKLGPKRCGRLVEAIRQTLERAISAGGSTLRDFVQPDGRPGYFQQEYAVYDREGEKCRRCGGVIRRIVQGQRSSYWCGRCQR